MNIKQDLSQQYRDKHAAKPLWLFCVVIASIFVTEALVMFMLDFLGDFHLYQVAVIDAVVLTIVMFPLLYLFLLRPMLVHIAHRTDAEKELIRSNESLLAEVAERKRADEELLLFKDLLNQSNDSIFVIDPETSHLLDLNDMACSDLKYNRDELLSIGMIDIDPSVTDFSSWSTHVENVRRHGHLIITGEHRRKDGTTFPIEKNVKLATRQGNEYIVTVVRDLTERKKAEEALQALVASTVGNVGQEFFDSIVKSLSEWLGADCVIVGDLDEERISSMSMKLDDKIIREFSYALEGTPCERSVRGGYCFFEEGVTVAYPEDKILVDMRAEGYVGIALNDKSDVPIGVVCAVSRSRLTLPPGAREVLEIIAARAAVEIERKRTEEALRESEERYRALFEESMDIVFISTPEGRFLDINPAGVELLRYPSKEELLNVDIAGDIYSRPGDRERFSAEIQKYGYVRDFETVMQCRDGFLINALITASAVKDNEGRIIAYRGILRDTTAQKKLESQLLQSQKMEAVGQLAGGVAHDFNNILTSIVLYAGTAIDCVKDTDRIHKPLMEILAASNRAASLTRQLLIFSRKQTVELTRVNLSATVEEMMSMLGRLIGEDISIKTELDPNVWTVMADKGNIEQMILNLTVNSMDAMPDGGSLSIRTQNVVVDEEYCKGTPDASPGKYVCMAVQDTGCGMEKEIASRIFEPFFTTKEAGSGTGLGLAVVHGIAKRYDGWINVYSEPAEGTTFRVYLKANPSATKVEPVRHIERDELKGHGERVLLVEDEDKVREGAATALRDNGYEVFEASNAEDALDTFEKQNRDFAVVFSDVVLPGRSGVQLAEELISRSPGIKVMLASGHLDHKSQWPLITERGYRFISKPYSLYDMLKTVKKALAVGS